MAVKTVADRTAIAASGAAAGDTVNIATKNETWKVVGSKLSVPSNTITVKLANGNFAFLSTPDTASRNESGAVPEFSSTIAYTAGSMVRRNGALFVAKQNMFSGSFAQEQWIEVQPGSNNSIVTRIVRLRPSSPGNSYFNNPSVTLGQ